MFKTSTAQVLSLQQMLSEMDIALDVEIKTQEVWEQINQTCRS